MCYNITRSTARGISTDLTILNSDNELRHMDKEEHGMPFLMNFVEIANTDSDYRYRRARNVAPGR